MKKCEGDKTVFNCKFCPYVNNRRDRLRKHTAQKHERKEDVYSCNFFEFNTTRKCVLVKHQKTHVVKDKDEMFECEVCKKTFGLKKTLYRHQRLKQR